MSKGGMSKGFKLALGLIGVVVLLFVAVIVIGALVVLNVFSPESATRAAPVTPAVAQAAPASAVWASITEWSGNGIKQTESFNTSTREWRIRWSTSNEAFAGAGILQIMVYNSSGGLVTLAANKQGVGSDVSYVRSAPGAHYLMINSGNVNWTVTVEEQR